MFSIANLYKKLDQLKCQQLKCQKRPNVDILKTILDRRFNSRSLIHLSFLNKISGFLIPHLEE